MDKRTSKNDYYFSLAEANSRRGTCLRRNFGAIIERDDVVLSMGYSGAPRGRLNCCDVGTCLREELKVPSGERYELCRSVHAEMNAVINAATSGTNVSGGDMYIFGWDMKKNELFDAYACKMCKRIIINAKLKKVHARTREGDVIWNVDDWMQEKE